MGKLARAKWDKVKESCPNMSITETMGEFAWPLTKAKKISKKFEVDISPSAKAPEKLRHEDH